MQDHFREFDFDVVLGPEYRQEHVYQQVGAPLVDEVLKGYSSTLLAYPRRNTSKKTNFLWYYLLTGKQEQERRTL